MGICQVLIELLGDYLGHCEIIGVTEDCPNWGKSAVEEAISIMPKHKMLLGQLKEALKLRRPI